ncbi:hypothetical protein PpBr36_07899 [Pyricularia pennisetigena]|uniref:hypothetical protein n=1 Tax=Pyricularia pennisetigena TaxID=1578925 RepID=UPI00115488CA|nr:hypothetical protein PpBr36_07899 [Pyricularia pennisetigena]TLS25278.1 hypothetical protein PpBr36_07899 [Pyricularia pennisetigena]
MSSDPSQQSTGTMPRADQSSPVRQCFICLLDSTETPENEDWVNPCPCTLEAHQSCMLRWVAEMEAVGGANRSRGRRASTLQCPACKGSIQVYEPFDPALWLRDRLLRTYSAVSPVLLVCFVGGSTFGAMVKFGDFSVATFAGSFSAVRKWRLDGIQRPLDPRWFATSAGLRFATVHMFKLWALASIGPALIIQRAFSGIDSLLLPVSLASSVVMTAKDNVPHWPPSPDWALTAMPAVSLCYSHVYYMFFGRFEKRLNAAIRGRNPDAPQEEAQVEQQEDDQDQQGPQEPGQRRRNDGDRGVNVWEAGLGRMMAHAVALVFGLGDEGAQDGEGRDDDDERLEIELEINLQVRDGEEEVQEAPQDQMAIARAPAGNEPEPAANDGALPIAAEVEPGQEPQVPAENAAPQPQVPGADQAAAQEAADPPPPIQPARQPQAQQNQAAEQPRQRRVEGAGISTWSRIINGTVSALLMPQISFAMGEALRLTLPARWVSKQGESKGLLQHTWGRSLVGTCLFVVLRDAVSLYVKYRRVQAIKNRTVKNFDPTVGAVGAGSTA